MKKVLIVTLATLMSVSAFAGRISGETVTRAKEELKLREQNEGPLTGEKAKKVIKEVAEKIANEKVPADKIEAGLEIIFEGDLVKKVLFAKALGEARSSSSIEAQNAAKYGDFLLKYLTETGLTVEHKKAIQTVLLNYAELMVSLGTEGPAAAAVKYETQLQSMAYGFHSKMRGKFSDPSVVVKLSLLAAFRGEFETKEQVFRTEEDLKKLNDKDKKTLEAKLKEFELKCGKQG